MSLRRLGSIVIKELRQLRRDRLTFAMIIGIPTMQLILFGYAINLDVRNLETAVQNREASLASARSQLDQTKAQIESSRVALSQAKDTLRRQEDLWRAGLVPRDTFERSQNDVKLRETDLVVSEQSVRTQEQRIKVEEANLASARFDLNKVRMESPIDGLVTKRNVEEGETAVNVTLGDGDDEAEIGANKSLGRFLLAILDTLRQIDLLLVREQRGLGDFAEVEANGIINEIWIETLKNV